MKGVFMGSITDGLDLFMGCIVLFLIKFPLLCILSVICIPALIGLATGFMGILILAILLITIGYIGLYFVKKKAKKYLWHEIA
jgi:hypothetical protein